MKVSFHLDFQTLEISIALITITALPKAYKLLSDTKSINWALPFFLLCFKDLASQGGNWRKCFPCKPANTWLCSSRETLLISSQQESIVFGCLQNTWGFGKMTVSCKRGHSFQSGIKTSSRDNHSLLYNLDRTLLQNKQNDGMTTLGALTPGLLTNSLLSTEEEPSKLKKSW